MKIRNMKQKDVSEKSGLHKAQISQYATGKYEPMQDALYKIAKALDVNVAWLMGHDVPMEIDKYALEQKATVCDLIEKCYGSGAYELIELFVRLNKTGRTKAIENLSDLVQLPKYTEDEKGEQEKMA